MKVKKAIEILNNKYSDTEMILHNIQSMRMVVNVASNREGTIVWFEDSSDESRHMCHDILTVKDIILLLKTFNPDATIKFHSESGPDVMFLSLTEKDRTKYMLAEGEYDANITGLIWSTFHGMQYTDETELDIYKWFLSVDIDVDMMRKYYGDEEADKMEKICKQHGLI